MDDDADAALVELGRRARERIAEQQASSVVVPPLDDARRHAMLLAVGVDPTMHAPAAAPAPSRTRATVVAIAVAAIAAALVLWFVRAPDPVAPASGPSLAVIYDLELAGGRAERLAAPTTPALPRYRQSDPLVVRMRPRIADPGPRVLSLRARPEAGGAALLVPALVTVDDGGMLELQAPLGELLPLVPGRWQLEVGVGLPGACEQDSEQGCTWASTTIEIVDGS